MYNNQKAKICQKINKETKQESKVKPNSTVYNSIRRTAKIDLHVVVKTKGEIEMEFNNDHYLLHCKCCARFALSEQTIS